MSALKFLRLNTFHYEFFDAGFYFNKIHRIMSGDFADALKIVLWEGHFQPLTILYYFLSPFTSNAEIAFLFETITLSLTAAILYKFAHHITNHSFLSLLIALSYLLNPLLHFNDILGFHPDHIIVPAIIGGFYFIEIKKPVIALFCFSFVCLSSEPWILSLWFIGFTIFMTTDFKKTGLFLSASSILIFVYIMLFFLPAGSVNSAGHVFSSENVYAILGSPSLQNFIAILDEKKLLFLYFIFLSTFFAPLVYFPSAIIFIPDFAKALLSTEPLHYAIEGHYTLVFLIVGYWSLLMRIKKMKSQNKKSVSYLPILCFCLIFCLNIGHGVMPWSYNFYSQASAGHFHVSKYKQGQQFRDLSLLLQNNPIPMDSHVETSNVFFSPEIGRVKKLVLFPSKNFESADVIIISNERIGTSGSENNDASLKEKYLAAQDMLSKCFKPLSTETVIFYLNNKNCD